MLKELFRLIPGAMVWLCPALALAADNPFIRVSLADSGAFKYNGEYYLCGGGSSGYIYSSRNLVDWGNARQAITHVGAWATTHPYSDPWIGCSDINYVNGVFHHYFQVDDKIGHATSTNVLGLYTEPVPATAFATQLDPHYFRDDNGSNYFYLVKFPSGNVIYGQRMSDPATFTGSALSLISAITGTWERVPSTETPINEGPFVFKYRGRYYLLYNANDTVTTNYQVGCAEAATPLGFNNSGKYPAPVLARTSAGAGEINTMGQPWVVEGPNGFEKWVGYFAIYTLDGGARFQCVDRLHFFDKKLNVDGPTDRYTAGYHPDPAKPTLLNLFNGPDGLLPATDWTPLGAGTWSVLNREARQTDQSPWSLNPVNRAPAVNYLIEANVKFNDAADGEDKAGVLAYYLDASNWMIVGIDRIAGNWYAHRQEAGVNTIVSGALWTSWNHSAYHKIRVERNGPRFDVRLDDLVPQGGVTPINTSFTAAGRPGIYTDHTSASFDGVIYTIGWDEFDAGVSGWGTALSGIPTSGNWNYGTNGIIQTNATGFNYVFKGDLMPQYEFETQVYRSNSVPADGLAHTMGIMPVAIDANNYLGAEINLTNNTIFTYGVSNGVALPQQSAAVAATNNYNLRAVRLPDRVILFVNGVERLTVNAAFGPSQVGLVNQNMAARYNGILVYRTEPLGVPAPWQHQDLGTVGFAGSADLNDGSFVINGSGNDIWDVNDGGHFVFQPFTGDGQIIARLDSLDPTDYWAKAGLMFRENLAYNSRMVYLAINAAGDGNGSEHQFMWRADPGAGTGIFVHTNNPSSQILPTQGWLKLVRQRNTFSAYYSTNGSSWNLIGSTTVNMAATAYVGMAVTAHNNTRVAGAVLDNVVLNPLPAARPNLILNGDFSGNAAAFAAWPGYTGGANPAAITNWTKSAGGGVGVNGAAVSFANPAPFGPTATGNRTYAFLQGGVNSLAQNLALTPGMTYQLSFEPAARAGNSALFRVQIGDASQVYVSSGNLYGNNAAFSQYSYTFTTPATLNGTPAIQLYNVTTGDNTICFANVSLVLMWPTTTALSASANPSTYGGAVTFTATVTTTNGIPTGTATFKDGLTSLGTGTLGNGSGNTATVMLTLTNLTAVSHNLTASYGGDTNFAASTSGAVLQGVNPKAMTVTGLTVSPKVYNGGTNATLSGSAALVGVVSGDAVTLNGTGVAGFADGNVGVAKPVYVSGYTLGGARATNYSLSLPILSASLTPRAVSLTGSRVYDGTAVVVASILTIANNIDGSNLTLSGSGTLAGKDAGAQAISAGTLVLGGLAATNYTLAGLSGSVTITTSDSTTALTSSANPSRPGTNAVFTATVTAVWPGSGTPTNQVQFRTNGVPAALVGLNASAQAVYATSWLPHGSNAITAEYVSDGNFLASTGSVLQVVNTAPVANTLSMGAMSGMPATRKIIGDPAGTVDADSDSLTVTAVGEPAHGSVSTDGTNVIYTATNDFAGSDSFTYTVGDGYGGGATNTVTVNVIANSEGFNQLSVVGSGENVVLTYLGLPGYNYALERTFNLSPPLWVPIATNPAATDGYLRFTNTPQPGTNNFWRTRSVP